MQGYDAYKESGVEWIGEIPEHWEVKKLKYIGKSIIGLTYNPDEVIPDDGVLVLRSSNIQEGKLSLKDCVYVDKDIPEKLVVKKGDILICSRNGSRALIGKNITIGEELEGNTFGAFMTVFRTDYYEFVSKYFNSQVFNGQSGLFLTSTVNQLTIHTLNNFYIALPPKEEQVVIANYLSKKTTEIDKLVTQKKQLLALYEEEKSAIINQAVTKGLDPDVTMKESGVPWLGEIPEHWEVIPIKYALEIPITDGPHETPEILNKGIPFLSAEAVKNDKLDFDKKRGYISQEDHERFTMKYKPKIGDVYMVKSGATTGNLAKVETEEEFSIWSPLAALRPKKDFMTTDFLFYFMKSKSFFHSVVLGWNYGTQQNIGMGVIANLKITHPPEEEQKVIVKYIIKELSIIFKKIEKTKKIIALQKEYRTALISEVVTGKVKVPEEI